MPESDGIVNSQTVEVTDNTNSIVRMQLQPDQLIFEFYQRDASESRVQKIAKNYNPEYLQDIDVAPTGNSTQSGLQEYAVLDGRARTTAIRRLRMSGHYIPFIHSRVHLTADTLAKRANLFDKLNDNRTTVSKMQRYKALVYAGDKQARAIDVVVKRFHLNIASTGHPDHTITTIIVIDNLNALHVLEKTLSVIERSWGFSKSTLSQRILFAIGMFCATYSEMDEGRLVGKLRNQEKNGPFRLLNRAEETLRSGTYRPHDIYRLLVQEVLKAYNLDARIDGKSPATLRLPENRRLVSPDPANLIFSRWQGHDLKRSDNLHKELEKRIMSALSSDQETIMRLATNPGAIENSKS